VITHYLRALAARLRGLFGDRRADRELDDEIETHLRLLTERHVRQGMTQAEAVLAARRQFGNVTLLKEANREMRGIRFIDTFFQDLRYGLTMMRRNPGLTFVSVLTLSLGIGANTAIFSVVNATLLRPLPYQDPDRLVRLSHHKLEIDGECTNDTDFLEWRDQAKAFEKIAASSVVTADLTGNGEPERLIAGRVSAGLFETLGIAPALGRAFTPEEGAKGGAPVVILSYNLWQRRFGGDRQVIGRALTLERESRTVVGIMPPGFRFPEESDLWTPYDFDIIEGTRLNVIGRLRSGVTLEAAREDLYLILKRRGQALLSNDSDNQVKVIGFRESLFGNIRLALLVLFGAVTFVLLIACVNVANLLLARSAARRKEMAIRAAVGAGRSRLVRQMLTESLLLSVFGGIAGTFAAMWCIKLLMAMSPVEIARIAENDSSFLVDGRVLGFTCLVAALVGLVAGIFPALAASKVDINEALSTTRGAQIGHGGVRRMPPALMIAELALALVLLVGAGLMIKSFLRLQAVPKGFNPEGVLTLDLRPGTAQNYAQGARKAIYLYQEVLYRVQALPGVQYVSLAGSLPLSKPGIVLEGPPERGKDRIITFNHISPNYFQTMGMQMRAGRPFSTQDGAESPKVAIINEKLARAFFRGKDPIGRRIGTDSPSVLATVVGVVADARHYGLDHEVYNEIYLPYVQHLRLDNALGLKLAVRVAPGQDNPASMARLTATIRDQVHQIQPHEPIHQIVSLDDRWSNTLAARRFQTLLLGVFAVLALVIATVGIHGVISYAVSRRTHEIGVRMALGARGADVLRMVVWWGMRMTLIGVALGVVAALALTRVMKNLLFEVSATDPATFAGVALILVVVALIASYIPARRATKVDPLQALHHE